MYQNRYGCLAPAIILAILLLAISGCSPKVIEREVPVVVEHTSTHNSVELRVDTIYGHDSTIIYIQGDTVIERHYNTIYKVHEIIRGDTIHDTIPRVVHTIETVVQKENVIYWWQKALMWCGGISTLILLVIIAFKFKKFW